MYRFILFFSLFSFNLFAADRNPIFFTTSTSSTYGSIKYWASEVTLTYEHDDGDTLTILKLTDTSVNFSCTITSYNSSSSLAVENLYRMITAISDQKRIIHCLGISNLMTANVTLDSTKVTGSKVTIETEVD